MIYYVVQSARRKNAVRHIHRKVKTLEAAITLVDHLTEAHKRYKWAVYTPNWSLIYKKED